jgi:RNA 3'-terminal phosphate cyclase (ATP)
MIELDGSYGEGGGQILRTALTLSMLTQTPMRIHNIRAKRKKSGLLRQHLTCVQAAQAISHATVCGAALGANQLEFIPQEITGGDYRFDIGSAGSCTLVLQTILLPLAQAKIPSNVQLCGGTHNPLAPSASFLQQAYLPLLAKMGVQVDLNIHRYGFAPAGGGVLKVEIMPMQAWQSLDLPSRGQRGDFYAESLIAAVPAEVARRELAVVEEKMRWSASQTHIVGLRSNEGPGNVLQIVLQHQEVSELFTCFGQKGKPAEAVALETCKEALHYLAHPVAVGEYLADQLLLPMALAGAGRFTTHIVSEHTRTNAAVIEKFLPVEINFEKLVDNTFVISVQR